MVSLQLQDVGAVVGGRTILTGITTPPLQGGRLVALLGPNAAGKSTLFRRIFGLLRGPGHVRIEGTTSARPLAYMPQDTGGRPVLSVYESVLLARMQGRRLKVMPQDHAQVDRVLSLLGIDTLRGQNAGDLSGGQRQLVGAAQALAQDPQILLMDEPTSALDLSRQLDLMALLQRLTREQGLLIVVAMHDLGHALRHADEAMVLDRGRLMACGPVAEVVVPSLLRRVYQVEARIETCSRGLPQLIVDGRANGGAAIAAHEAPPLLRRPARQLAAPR